MTVTNPYLARKSRRGVVCEGLEWGWVLGGIRVSPWAYNMFDVTSGDLSFVSPGSLFYRWLPIIKRGTSLVPTSLDV